MNQLQMRENARSNLRTARKLVLLALVFFLLVIAKQLWVSA
ncbi:hypothetical protein [Chitinibacter sp. S2-10]